IYIFGDNLFFLDTITHIVLGAALGEVIAGKKMGKRAMLWGALANNAPDLDIFLSPFQTIPDSLLSHRGFTHSILFAMLVPPALAWIFNHLHKGKAYGFKTWYLIFASGLFAHILVDSFTNYGTGWFEPFSHYRVSFNTIFVADPFYTIALLISFIALLILKSKSVFRKYFLIGGLTISTGYLFFTFINKFSINQVFIKTLEEKNLEYSSFITTPTPLNNFLWYCLAKNDSGFYFGYRSLFDHGPLTGITFVPKNDSLLEDLRNDPGIQKLIRFSQQYYCITKSDSGGLDFHDLRFGQVGGWHNPKATFVFSYHITKGINNTAYINQGRFEAVTGDEFRELIQRIKGIN
ncbi:MAG TPA: metal-dependent hydrolase, partial [Cyclobacteriaceae bacterium]|nr:metal-dependent hydrolase [Cyclobacteriaceae bacterium]